MNESLANLLAWINTHDCGVMPCGVMSDDGESIIIRGIVLHMDGTENVIEERVFSYKEARIALGY